MPLARPTKSTELTPEQSAAEREVADMLAEVERVYAADRVEMLRLYALDEHDPDEAARFAELAALDKHRRRTARDAAERERRAAERYDRKAKNAEWLDRQPKGGREAYLMLAAAGYPLTTRQRREANEARRLAREAADAERAAVMRRLDETRDGRPTERPTQRTDAPQSPPRPTRSAPRVVFVNPYTL